MLRRVYIAFKTDVVMATCQTVKGLRPIRNAAAARAQFFWLFRNGLKDIM
jgi:hypothetical protein